MVESFIFMELYPSSKARSKSQSPQFLFHITSKSSSASGYCSASVHQSIVYGRIEGCESKRAQIKSIRSKESKGANSFLRGINISNLPVFAMAMPTLACSQVYLADKHLHYFSQTLLGMRLLQSCPVPFPSQLQEMDQWLPGKC